MYDISFDADESILTVRLEGFWTTATHARFLAEAFARGLALRIRHGTFGVFVDCSNYPIQTGSLVEKFEPLIARAERRGIPIVLLNASTLAKMQAQRTLGATGLGIFTDADEAMRWLTDRLAARAA